MPARWFGVVFFTVLAMPLKASALITCDPPSCSPGCGSCCDYKVCDKALTANFDVRKLPFPLPEPADACAFTAPNPLKEIPKTWSSAGQSVEIREIPKSLNVPYLGCSTYQNCGPPCPPPP